MEASEGGTRRPESPRATRRARQRHVLDLVANDDVANQEQLAALLRARGFDVTQATVSRDIADLGLVKAARGDRHVYAAPATLAAASPRDDSLLRRVLRDVPFQVRRSGLILVLVSSPGTASIIAEAIDHSTLADQVGTLAGDNTVLVLFPDESSLERWQGRLLEMQAEQASPA
jgi:transcriptional regulator of arginine metabolism